jgi:hypothetical protein
MQSPTRKPSIYFEIDGQSHENECLENEPYYFDDITIEKAAEILCTLNKVIKNCINFFGCCFLQTFGSKSVIQLISIQTGSHLIS